MKHNPGFLLLKLCSVDKEICELLVLKKSEDYDVTQFFDSVYCMGNLL